MTVGRHKRAALDERLRHQHAVKQIAVVHWQRGRCLGVLHCHGQFTEAILHESHPVNLV